MGASAAILTRIAVSLITIATAACSGAVSPTAVPSNPPAATASPTVAPTLAPTAAQPSRLEGTWTTAMITCDQLMATIKAEGFTDAQISDSGWTCSQPVHYRLRFLADRFAQLQNEGEGAFERGSGRSFELLDDHTLFLTDGQQTLTFTLVGNVLTFLSVSGGGAGNLDGRVHGAAIFLTAPFIKEP